jgi:hypothetical protein
MLTGRAGDVNVKRSLGSRLGSLKEKVAA